MDKIYTCICGKKFNHPNGYNGHKTFCRLYRLSIGKDPDANINLNKKKLQKGIISLKKIRASKHSIEQRYCKTCGKLFEVDNFSTRKCCSEECSHSRNNSGPSLNYMQKCEVNRLKVQEEKIKNWKQSNPICKFCAKLIPVDEGQPFRNFCNNTCKSKYANTFKTEESHLRSTRKGNAHHG